jgi:hypothetical protein
LVAENTPWLGLSIDRVAIGAAREGESEYNHDIEVYCEITNYSDRPANRVEVSCDLNGVSQELLIAPVVQSQAYLAVMPKETVHYTSYVFLSTNADIERAKTMLERGEARMDFVVVYEDTFGNKTEFSESFIKRGETYKVTNLQFDSPKGSKGTPYEFTQRK